MIKVTPASAAISPATKTDHTTHRAEVMVGYTPGERELSHTAYITAGALSGVITRSVTQPIDFLKIRFQLQVEPISRASQSAKYKGSFQSLATIIKEESWTAFWKGHIPSQSLSAVFMATEFATFEVLTKQLYTRSPNESNKSANHFISGAGAGVTATIVSYPLDVVRTRFVAQGNDKVYKSFYQAFSHIYRADGIMGFYRGLQAAICHSAPQSALYFGLYELFKQTLNTMIPNNYTGSITAVSGASAGVLSKLMVYPFDTSKRRLQVIGFEHGRKGFGATRYYSGITHHIKVSYMEEGIRGLYKGATWAFIKAGVGTSMYFFFYEKICMLIRQHNDMSDEF